VWAVWHWVPLLQVGWSVPWIAWWTLCSVAVRVVMVWLFVNTGRSVFAMALFRAAQHRGRPRRGGVSARSCRRSRAVRSVGRWFR
jgi:hypothetical protein